MLLYKGNDVDELHKLVTILAAENISLRQDISNSDRTNKRISPNCCGKRRFVEETWVSPIEKLVNEKRVLFTIGKAAAS